MSTGHELVYNARLKTQIKTDASLLNWKRWPRTPWSSLRDETWARQARCNLIPQPRLKVTYIGGVLLYTRLDLWSAGKISLGSRIFGLDRGWVRPWSVLNRRISRRGVKECLPPFNHIQCTFRKLHPISCHAPWWET